MIVPAAAGDAPPSSFHAAFNPPGLEAEAPPPPPETTTTVTTAAASSPTTTEAAPATSPSSPTSPTSPSAAFSPPPTTPSSPAPAPSPSPSVPGYADGGAPTTVSLPAQQASVSGDTGTPWNKGIILIGIASVVGSIAGVGRNQLRRRDLLSLDS